MPRAAPQPASESYAQPAPIRTDPLATFSRAPVILRLGDRDFTIEVPTAEWWVDLFMAEVIDWNAIMPGLLEKADQNWVELQLLQGNITQEEFQKTTLEFLDLVSGWKWYITLGLFSVVKNSWDFFGGRMMLSPLSVPKNFTLAAYMLGMLRLVLDNSDPKSHANFIGALTTPPPGFEEELDEEEENKAFFAAMAMG